MASTIQVPPAEQREQSETAARPKLIAEAAVTSAQDQMTGGVVLLGYALLLGADTFQIGLLSTAQMVGASLQLVSDGLMQKLRTRKRVGIAALAAVACGRFLLGLLPAAMVWVASDALPWALLAGLVFISGAGQIGQVTRLSWIGDLISEERRGRFLGDRHFAALLVGSLVGVGAAWVVDWHQAYRPEHATTAAQGLFLFAAVLATASIAILRRVPEPIPQQNGNQNGPGLLAPLVNRRFRPLMIYHSLWQFSAPLAAPFFNLYLIVVLEMPLGVVALYAFLGQLANLYTVRMWGRLTDRFGNLPVLRLCVAMKAVFPVLWILMWPAEGGTERVLLYIVAAWVHLWRSFNPGQQLATVNLALNLSPEGQSTRYLAAYRTLGNWIHAVAPGVGGFIAAALQDAGWSQHLSICVLFALSGMGRMTALMSTRFIREPGSPAVSRMIRSVRRVPGFTLRHGLAPFVRFWGGPAWSGFAFVRARMGNLVSQWRGVPGSSDE